MLVRGCRQEHRRGFFATAKTSLTSFSSVALSFALPPETTGIDPEDGPAGLPFCAVLACVFGGLRMMAFGKRGLEETARGG